jgi:phosphate binding protein
MTRQVALVLVCAALLPAAAGAQQTAAGSITVKGSDTIGGELGPALARRFEQLHPGVQVVWEALGSKTAFVGLFDGSAALGASSRQVNEAEYKEAQRLGVDLQEFTLGFDGIAAVVHPSNSVPQLTIEQFGALFLGKVTNWKEVGGPDLPVTLYTRPTYSGTRGWFEEKVLRKGNAKGPEQMSPAAQVLETNEQIIPRVGKEPGAVSYVGLGSLAAEIRPVPLAAGEKTAVAPTLEAVRGGTYPLFRPLFLYSRGAPTGLAAELLRFVLSAEGQQLVAQHGFVPGGSKASDVAQTAGAAQAPAAPVQLLRLPFASGQIQLGEKEAAQLKEAIAKLDLAHARLRIVGHADQSGSPARNAKVSLRRARSVAAKLVQLGVPNGSLTVEGQGSDAPLASNDQEQGRRQNRRVDLFVLQ